MNSSTEKLVEKQVTYTIEIGGKIYAVENVPARVNEETGEYFFLPATVEHLQEIIMNKTEPDRVIEVPIYNYAA